MIRNRRRMLPWVLAGWGLLRGWATLPALAQRPAGELRWAVRSDPKTFDPAKVDDAGSELVRYLTAGVLVRLDRRTMQPRPELAESWTVSADGRTVVLKLRGGLKGGLRFSDGSPLTARDAAWSIRRVLAKETGAPVAEEFVTPGEVRVDTPDAATVRVQLPGRVVGILGVFDEIAVEPADRPSEGRVTAGPFVVAEHRAGEGVRLVRNAHYWEHDAGGRGLPYAPSIRLDVLANRENEVARFGRGEYDLIDGLLPDYYGLLAARMPGAVRDLGPSLNTEQMWFNQSPGAPLPDYEKMWFSSRAFRVAVSEAIRRADLARIAYEGHATPAYGFVSPANRTWYNGAAHPPREDAAEAVRVLAGAGFRRNGKVLVDAGGHPVRFSIVTNAGNAARAKMAAMIQQDLAGLGMEVTVVTLDFPALIERLMHTQNYEACLLGHPNVPVDPNAMRNEWVSSSPNHQWNPGEKTPATAWEAEIDRAMETQAGTGDFRARKKAFDRVQEIVAEQQPYVYLVYPNTMYAVSPALKGVEPTVFQPGLVWNIEELHR